MVNLNNLRTGNDIMDATESHTCNTEELLALISSVNAAPERAPSSACKNTISDDERPSVAEPLEKLPEGPWRSLGGYFDYSTWADRDRFLELDRAIAAGQETPDRVALPETPSQPVSVAPSRQEAAPVRMPVPEPAPAPVAPRRDNEVAVVLDSQEQLLKFIAANSAAFFGTGRNRSYDRGAQSRGW